ncbi:hypothetical protein V6N13_057395 [Hibiscus sabdariffa]
MVRQGPGTTGLSPSPAPLSRGLGPGPSLRMLLQTTIRMPRVTDSQAGLFPVRSPFLRESFQVSFPPLIDMLKLSGAEISIAESHFVYSRQSGHVFTAHAPRTGVRQQTTTFSFRFLGVIHTGDCLFCHRDMGSHVTETGRRRGAMMLPHPLPRILDNTFTGRSARQVQWTSREAVGREPPTSPRSENFTGPFNRMVSDHLRARGSQSRTHRLPVHCSSCSRGESGSPLAGRGTDWEWLLRGPSPAPSGTDWYGQGESDCLIKTNHYDGPSGCSRNVISAQCSECQSEEIQPSAGKRRE